MKLPIIKKLTHVVVFVFMLGVLGLVSSSSVEAVTQEVEGRVVTQGTNAPIGGVWVRWNDQGWSGDPGTPGGVPQWRYARTDANGYFYFESWDKLEGSDGSGQNNEPWNQNRDGQLSVQIDSDLDGVNDTNLAYFYGQASFDCSTNPHNLSVITPAGWGGTFTTISNFNVVNNGSTLDVGTITYSGFDISGNVFIDSNRNGVRDGGESSYQGATINRAGPSAASTTSNVNGDYSFINLGNGSYTVSINAPPGYTVTNGASRNVTLGPDATVNFGIVQLSMLSGNVFNDSNRNGVRDVGETNYQGATLTRSGASSGTTTSDASGNYTFANLSSGNYSVALTVPAGYAATTATSQARTLPPNGTANFGIVQQFSIGGNVFNDINRNGTKDVGDPDRANVTVTLSGAANATDVTDVSGNYSFGNLFAGSYTLTMSVPAGSVASTTNPQTTTLGPNRTINFGLGDLYRITGVVFNDINKNGIKDAGEANYPGVPSVTASRGTVTNGANGTYTISNLTAGTVTVSFNSLPNGYKMSYPLNGPPPSFQVTVGPGCGVNGARGATCN